MGDLMGKYVSTFAIHLRIVNLFLSFNQSIISYFNFISKTDKTEW